ncbi:molybdopterin-dependent oxidoreductase [Variovorax sp. GT1P44]|uniref:molybdopterin-dependent oxidoreductase n=1 Tax=Variovorax sp. GT1P44 TaxID=3443742 RepID=UPI003F45597B
MHAFSRRLLVLLAFAAWGLAGCGSMAPTTSASLQVGGALDRPAKYAVSELSSRPATTQVVHFSSGSGAQSHTYVGTSLWQLLDGSGIRTDGAKMSDALNRYVLATGADGYRAVFSLGEINPAFGNQQSLVAYAEVVDGRTVPLGVSDGPLRVTAPGDTKGGRYVSRLAGIELRASESQVRGTGGGVSTAVAVSGAVDKPMTFDLAALKAMPSISRTVNGSTYTGVSLWTLLHGTTGIKVDPTVKNASMAMYVVATGSDGYKAVIALGEIDPDFGNKMALVAYSVNGAPLDRNGMARLIVPGDVKMGRSVSNLAAIEVLASPRAAP